MTSSFSRRRRQSLATPPLALALDPSSGALWISSGTGDILTYRDGTFRMAVNASALAASVNMSANQIGTLRIYIELHYGIYSIL